MSGPWSRIVDWACLFQNYHLIHQLFPRIPFYLYSEAFKDLRPVLEKQHARIHDLGH